MTTAAYEYISTAASTDVTAIGTFVKAAGTTTLEYNTSDWSMPANNRLQYDGGVTKAFLARARASIEVCQIDPINTYVTVTLAFAVNGVVDSSTEAESYIHKTAGPKEISLEAALELDDGDYVEVWITATRVTDVKLEKLSVVLAAV